MQCILSLLLLKKCLFDRIDCRMFCNENKIIGKTKKQLECYTNSLINEYCLCYTVMGIQNDTYVDICHYNY